MVIAIIRFLFWFWCQIGAAYDAPGIESSLLSVHAQDRHQIGGPWELKRTALGMEIALSLFIDSPDD